MQKRVSFEDMFDNYLSSKQNTVKPPERPFGALRRDMAIQNLMQGSIDHLEQHEASLAREQILNTQIQRIAREHKVPASLVSKMVQRPQVDLCYPQSWSTQC